MRALTTTSSQAANLSDPAWLIRVGLDLEFVTFLGIFEAVHDEAVTRSHHTSATPTSMTAPWRSSAVR